MAINRLQLVGRHNPILTAAEFDSPLTVGNGELGYTADVTGMQTLYEEYQEVLPLCTMSQWGWHTKPVNENQYAYTLADLVMSEYDYNGRTVRYPKKKMPENEAVYDWLRENPHRLNLGRIGLFYRGASIKLSDLTEIHQELHLYEGILESSFCLNGILCKVRTACDYSKDILAFGVESEALADGTLQVKLEFPYGSPLKSAADWGHPEHHRTEVVESKDRELILKRTLDRDSYYVAYHSREASETVVSGHEVLITAAGGSLEFTVSFGAEQMTETAEARTVWESSRTGWKNYWEHGGIVELAKSKDKRAVELECRIILSQYLSAINSCGSRPPQETGLTCNSWYGKMHLEMYLWHCAWLPLWNQTELLERSLPWYASHLEEARKNAAVNGYAGARWPKMIASEGIDCPSPVAPLLIWQQPHIIYMLELAYQQNQSKDFLEKYWILIKESAEFMADFTVYNQETSTYDLVSPVIPVQECHRPEDTKNPAFEVAYWRFTLKLAVEWAERLGIACDPLWEKIADHMAGIPHDEHFYLAHDHCPDTFERFNRDHPSMVGAFGLIAGDRVDAPMMKNTLNRVMDCWDYTTLWGWDFAMMAMTAVRLHDPEMAIEILLKDTPKNSYVTSGNNFQRLRPDLPLYLPGNGALLLAIPMMTAGYAGCTEALPGFPKNGLWTVEYENINPYFK